MFERCLQQGRRPGPFNVLDIAGQLQKGKGPHVNDSGPREGSMVGYLSCWGGRRVPGAEYNNGGDREHGMSWMLYDGFKRTRVAF